MSIIEVLRQGRMTTNEKCGRDGRLTRATPGRPVRRVTLAAAALAAGMVVLMPGVASAIPDGPGPPVPDRTPCQGQKMNDGIHRLVQSCPLTRDGVPVFDSPSKGNGARRVGTLVRAGTDQKPANWFIGQTYQSNYVLGQYSNRWWAYTLSDNGTWGWVPEVYFRGGGNNVADSGLLRCGARMNPCVPPPTRGVPR